MTIVFGGKNEISSDHPVFLMPQPSVSFPLTPKYENTGISSLRQSFSLNFFKLLISSTIHKTISKQAPVLLNLLTLRNPFNYNYNNDRIGVA